MENPQSAPQPGQPGQSLQQPQQPFAYQMYQGTNQLGRQQSYLVYTPQLTAQQQASIAHLPPF